MDARSANVTVNDPAVSRSGLALLPYLVIGTLFGFVSSARKSSPGTASTRCSACRVSTCTASSVPPSSWERSRSG